MNRFLAVAKRHWMPLAVFNLAVAVIAGLNAQSVEDIWSAKAKLILPSTPTDLNLNLGVLGDLGGNDGLIFSQQVDSRKIIASILLSNDSLIKVRELDPEKELYGRIDEYKSLFNVQPDDSSTIITLSVEASTPEIAHQRLETLIEIFQQRLNQLRRSDADQRSEFIQKELIYAESTLAEAERELVSFKEKYNLVDSDSQTKELVGAISSLRVIQGEVSAQFEASKSQVSSLSSRLGQTPDQAIRALQLSEDQDYQAIQERLSELGVEIVDARAQFTDEHPQVQYLLDQRDTLLKQQQEAINKAAETTAGINPSIGQGYSNLVERMILAESEKNALQQQVIQLQSQVGQLNRQLQAMPSAQAQLAVLQRRYDIAESVYNGLTAQVQVTQVNAFSIYPNVQVLDQPAGSPTPVGPGRKPIALGALLTIIFGNTAIILFLESRNPLLTANDVLKTGLPIVGKISYLRQLPRENYDCKNIYPGFQRLASVISMTSLESRTLIITSASKGEGKTTVTIGLANALLSLGFRVLVVDADFQNSHLKLILSYENQKDEHSKNQPISINSGLDLLVPKPNKQGVFEFLARGGFEQVLNFAQMHGKYDYVLIDTPPTSLGDETMLMSQFIHNILLVAWPSMSNYNPFHDSLEQLNRHQANVLGLVINGIGNRRENYLYRHREVEII
ncbi:exopolysaccharide transport family protein [Nodosilinea sp. E11]|uniref:exopolysaccharide transport family protein n=1 Tax=Nodosilinea sp. E11 TaxID=3037479 RepID=UPI002934D547|nr:P-loop NTPase [Nodosilinea sp. E11]WOD37416.1 P-loop NTPase [Nodosilinea sp. E11]